MDGGQDPHHSNDGLKFLRGQAQAGDDTANGRGGGRHKRVRPKVQVQHGGIGALH